MVGIPSCFSHLYFGEKKIALSLNISLRVGVSKLQSLVGQPVYVNRVLLEIATPTYLHTAFGCFGTVTAQLSNCNRDSMVCKP